MSPNGFMEETRGIVSRPNGPSDVSPVREDRGTKKKDKLRRSVRTLFQSKTKSCVGVGNSHRPSRAWLISNAALRQKAKSQQQSLPLPIRQRRQFASIPILVVFVFEAIAERVAFHASAFAADFLLHVGPVKPLCE